MKKYNSTLPLQKLLQILKASHIKRWQPTINKICLMKVLETLHNFSKFLYKIPHIIKLFIWRNSQKSITEISSLFYLIKHLNKKYLLKIHNDNIEQQIFFSLPN